MRKSILSVIPPDFNSIHYIIFGRYRQAKGCLPSRRKCVIICDARCWTLTEKLYYYDGHLANFTAKVLSCTEENGRYAVVLDRTAFFPGGGGQDADEGELGGMRLLGLREDGKEIIHLVPGALQPGAEVGDLAQAARPDAAAGAGETPRHGVPQQDRAEGRGADSGDRGR